MGYVIISGMLIFIPPLYVIFVLYFPVTIIKYENKLRKLIVTRLINKTGH